MTKSNFRSTLKYRKLRRWETSHTQQFRNPGSGSQEATVQHQMTATWICSHLSERQIQSIYVFFELMADLKFSSLFWEYKIKEL